MSNYSVILKGIGIENFKAFCNYQYFSLAPLTIITGPNNSGKSALIAALELISKNDFLANLDFHSEGLEIGEYSQILNTNSGSKEIKLVLDFQLSGEIGRESPTVLVNSIQDFKLVLSYSEVKLRSIMLMRLEIIIEDEVRFATRIENLDDGEFAKQSCLFDYAFFEGKYLDRLMLQQKKNSDIKAKGRKKKFDDDSSVLPEFKKITEASEQLFEFLSSQPDYESFVQDFKGVIIDPSIIVEIPVLQDLEDEIRKELNAKYICRDDIKVGKPMALNNIIHDLTTPHYKDEIFYEQDSYRFSELVLSFLNNAGKTDEFEEIYDRMLMPSFKEFLKVLGKDLLGILFAAREEIHQTVKLQAHRASSKRLYLYEEIDNPLTKCIINAAESNDKSEREFLKKWTGEIGFNLFEDFRFEHIQGVGYRFEVFKDNGWRELSDLGYGTRQVLPVILGVFYHIMPNWQKNKSRTKNMVIIEEPESNLHPKLQSLLANLFVAGKKGNHLPLVIETHSEYLIRKLQFLVAKKEILPSQIVIHYIGEDNIGSVKDIFEIKINADGSLDKCFGSGFFDEADNLAIDLFIFSKHQKN